MLFQHSHCNLILSHNNLTKSQVYSVSTYLLHFFQHCDKILAFFLGWAGAALILMFTVNAAFIGSRLGLCWVILEERYEEFRREIRDPYPSIGEKAVGRWGR